MKKAWAFVVSGLLLLSCSKLGPRDYSLSPGDKTDIAGMALLIRDEPVDSIVVEDFSCFGVIIPPCGVIYFHPEQIDSDKVVFSKLEFSHIDWPIYSYKLGPSSFINDSNLIVSNGWATSIKHLYCDSALVVHFDSCSLSVLYWNHPRKDTMLYYLNKIYNHDYTLSYHSRGVDMPSLCSNAGNGELGYWQYSRSDSTSIQLSFPRTLKITCMDDTWTYYFIEHNSELSYVGRGQITP